MYLLDTNVISEIRRGRKANHGVLRFMDQAPNSAYIPVQVLGEMRQGIENLQHRGDLTQARRLEEWFQAVQREFSQRILEFDASCALR
jgi:predicted nucleic acid-binding protein